MRHSLSCCIVHALLIDFQAVLFFCFCFASIGFLALLCSLPCLVHRRNCPTLLPSLVLLCLSLPTTFMPTLVLTTTLLKRLCLMAPQQHLHRATCPLHHGILLPVTLIERAAVVGALCRGKTVFMKVMRRRELLVDPALVSKNQNLRNHPHPTRVPLKHPL